MLRSILFVFAFRRTTVKVVMIIIEVKEGDSKAFETQKLGEFKHRVKDPSIWLLTFYNLKGDRCPYAN